MRRARQSCALLFALLWAAPARGEDVPQRTVQFSERGKFLTMSVAMPDLVDEAFKKKLASGFASTVVMRAYLYREGFPEPLGFTPRSYRVVYDLWDEVYLVKVSDPLGELNYRFRTQAEALALLTKLDNFPLAALETIPPGMRFFVAVLVEVDPISPELLAQVRRWLAHPGTGERLSGGSTLLGSFVSVFINSHVNEAARVLKFRSQPFYRAERPEAKRPEAKP
jgi:hypothetical protein